MLYTVTPKLLFFAASGEVHLEDSSGVPLTKLPSHCRDKLFLITEEQAQEGIVTLPGEQGSPSVVAMGAIGRFGLSQKGQMQIGRAFLLASSRQRKVRGAHEEWHDLSFKKLMGELAPHVSVRGQSLKLGVGALSVFLQFPEEHYRSVIRQDTLVRALLALSVKPGELRGAPHIERFIQESQKEVEENL